MRGHKRFKDRSWRLNLMHSALGQAVRWDLIATNPADRIDRPQPAKSKWKAPPDAVLRALIDAAEPEARCSLLGEGRRLLRSADDVRVTPDADLVDVIGAIRSHDDQAGPHRVGSGAAASLCPSSSCRLPFSPRRLMLP